MSSNNNGSEASQAIKGKYVPPHRRSSDQGEAINERHGNDSGFRRDQYRRNSPFNVRARDSQSQHNADHAVTSSHFDNRNKGRRDLSQGSKFNTRTQSSPPQEPPKIIKPIEVPETVDPPIVIKPNSPPKKSVGTDDSMYSNILRKGLETVPTPVANNPKPKSLKEIKPEKGAQLLPAFNLPAHLVELLEELAKITVREAEEDFEEWREHYQNELVDMYQTCVDPKLGLLYEEFVRIAYKCTTTEFNSKKFKQTRPLI